jgi:voltage-gated potassium channel
LPGSEYLLVIRSLRLLRIFRVLKLVQYLGEADLLMRALSASRRKITLFLFTIVNLVVILGSLMYVIEGGQNGFTSIPTSIYWAVITLTTVGYGDIVPETGMGQAVATVVMIIGYSIIAVPTGIITSEISYASRYSKGRVCQNCSFEGHDSDAKFCKRCGAKL